MLKRRRFWVVVGCVLTLAVAPLLFYRLWWYPQTPRGCVGRIRIGMTAAEVRAILDPLEEGRKGWNGDPTRVERWDVKDGEVVYAHSEDARTAFAVHVVLRMRRAAPFFGMEKPGAKFLDIGGEGPCVAKATDDGIIFVELDDRGRVTSKVWLEFHRDAVNPLERLSRLLPF